MRFKRIAITVPTPVFDALERARRELGKSRSAAVAAAIEEWIRGLDAGEEARRYVEGYLRYPETADEIAVTEAIAVAATADWDPWPGTGASRAAEPRAAWARGRRSRRVRR
jgi:metal-responsive CopG/Arc/MetJ family transcriptional regulator